MAFKSVAVPWLGGGLIVLGYATFSWLRARHLGGGRAEPTPRQLPPLPNGRALLLAEMAQAWAREPHANGDPSAHRAALGASFLGRASVALSPFGPTPRGAR